MPQIIASSIEKAIDSFMQNSGHSSCLLLSDKNVYQLYGENLFSILKQHIPQCHIFCLESGEQAKNLANVEECWKKMHLCKMDRKSLLLTLGGGVVTDVGGFIASCYMRGIDVVHIPTTLLAMVDASIGGKTGINLPSGKNLIGTFFIPQAIFIDSFFLHSLPNREFISGMAEIIKYGIIWDENLFDYVEKNITQILARKRSALQHILSRSIEIKNTIVEKDPHEKGLRALLNYGHTFAHALETITGYNKLSHGEAVSIGMSCAAHVSLVLGYTSQEFIIRQNNLCSQAGLPTRLPKELDKEMIIQLMRGDKKNISGKIRLILPHQMGKVTFDNEVASEIIKQGLMLSE